MDKQAQDLLPFKVGQLAESRSFISGFRGAWFRCKIKEFRSRQGKIELALEFFDFPDDSDLLPPLVSTPEVHHYPHATATLPSLLLLAPLSHHYTTIIPTNCTSPTPAAHCHHYNVARLYQIPPSSSRSKEKKRELMLRPQYPPICHKSQLPPGNTISEVTVVNNGVWKVGDLVDWLTDGCYWSGRVIKILGNDKVQIELPPPPDGEGSSYEVFCKDLRPSLEWSPEHGWSVPTSKEGENCRHFTRLIKPMNQAGIPNLETIAGDRAKAELPFDASSSLSSNSLLPVGTSKDSITTETHVHPLSIAIPKRDKHMQEALRNLDMGDSVIGKTSLSHSLGHVRDASAEPAGEDQYYCRGPVKKMRTGGSISLNSMCSDTIEAPILDLEELVNRVKWLKGILEFGVPLSNAGRPPWKFLEHHASSTQK
ncbi:agenet domain-containing protein [Actinidia rufa]|uniref:Agenet domain-containing protein n=1 Tax=Actinidia rufa TaxID=165716 RepID=A0A7J0FHX3_9ERIC|nr:agenet domain-containing protein [Actinidia rufa]